MGDININEIRFLILLYAMNIMSVTQNNVPSKVVYYYCAWYVFLRDRSGGKEGKL